MANWNDHQSAGSEYSRKIVIAQADEIQLLKVQIQQEVKEKYQDSFNHLNFSCRYFEQWPTIWNC